MDLEHVNKVLEEALENLSEVTLWSGKVKTKWHPPKDFFTQSADKIASATALASTFDFILVPLFPGSCVLASPARRAFTTHS